MYIPGRLRTASSPLRTWIESALYCGVPSATAVSSLGHRLRHLVPGPQPGTQRISFTRPGPPRVEAGEDPGRHQTQFVGPRRRGDADPEHPVRGDRLGRGDRGDLRSDQLRPLLDDARLLHPLGEARLLEVARQGVGQRGGRASLASRVTFPASIRQTGSARSGGSSSSRGAVRNTWRSGASSSRRASRRCRSRSNAANTSSSSSAGSVPRAARSAASSISLSATAAPRCWPLEPNSRSGRPPTSRIRSSRCGPTWSCRGPGRAPAPRPSAASHAPGSASPSVPR